MSLSESVELPPGWSDFPKTVLHFSSTPPFSIDLRLPVTANQRAKFEAAGLERSFCILTAQDPCGKTLPVEENQALAMKLQQELEAARRPYVPLDACSPDRSHCESSVAVSLPREDGVTLAQRYEQLAIFWFDGDRFWIVPAAAHTSAVPLPVDSIS